MKKILAIFMVMFVVIVMFSLTTLTCVATESKSNNEQNVEDIENGVEDFLRENYEEQKRREENVKEYLKEQEKHDAEEKKKAEKLEEERKKKQEYADKIFNYCVIFNIVASVCVLFVSIKFGLPKSYMLLPMFFSIFGLIGFILACINRRKRLNTETE